MRNSLSELRSVKAGRSKMCEEKIGWRLGRRTGEELVPQTVIEVTKRAPTGVNGERIKTNGSVF
jgi:hypothetical protein